MSFDKLSVNIVKRLRPDSFALRFLQKTENDMLSPLALPQGIISSEYALKISDLSYQRSFYV